MRLLVFVLASVLFAQLAPAATLSSYASKEGKQIIILNGEIASGDLDQLQNLVKGANAAGRMVSGIRLNSPGGALLEAVKIADVVRHGKIATVVPNGQTCASACFVIFAAGGEKYASYSASVGVHGASDKSGKDLAMALWPWQRSLRNSAFRLQSLARWWSHRRNKLCGWGQMIYVQSAPR